MENDGDDRKTITLKNVNAELYGKFRALCVERGIEIGEGFEQAVNAWLLTASSDDLLSQPPFNSLPPKIQDAFRTRCEQKGCSISEGILDAVVVWLRNFSFTDPPLIEEGKANKKRGKK